MKKKLPAKKFIRVHRSYIISIDKIESVKKSIVQIREKIIPISDFYRKNFLKIVLE